MTEEPGTDDHAIHRRFAVGLNNQVYDGIAALGPDSSPLDQERVLYAAYASTYHWLQIGDEANHARGEYLIAKAALAVGRTDVALHHALRCLGLVDAHPEVMADWDRPFAYEVVARALAANGDEAGARRALDEVERLTALVADPEDRAVIEDSLGEPPWFGLR